MTIKILAPNNKAVIKEIVYLHKTLLPDSRVTKLGPFFLEKFYYSKLPANDLIQCAFYLYEQKPVGFIAYTNHATDFLSRGLRNNFVYLFGISLWSVLQKPSRLSQIVSVLRMMFDTKNSNMAEEIYDGEILSLGVLPQYRNLKFIQKSGVRISYDLFNYAKDFFYQNKLTKFRMLIQTDNKEASFFYHSLGCKFHHSCPKTGLE